MILRSKRKLTAEISEDKSNDRLCHLIRDITEEFFLFSLDKPPEDAYDSVRVKQCLSSLASVRKWLDRPLFVKDDFRIYGKLITEALIELAGDEYPETVNDSEHHPIEMNFCELCKGILDHLVHLIESTLNESGAETDAMSGHKRRKVLDPEEPHEDKQPEQKFIASVRRGRFIFRTSKSQRGCRRSFRLVTDIAKVLLSSTDTSLEKAYDLESIRWCTRKLAREHNWYDQKTLFSLTDFEWYWKNISDALIHLALAKYKEPIFDDLEIKFCKLCLEILDHTVHQIESRLDEISAKTHDMSCHTKTKETEDFNRGKPEDSDSDDIATEMHCASKKLELENQPLLLRALPYLLQDNKKSVHLYVYSGDRDTVEELKKKAEETFSKFHALIECTDLAINPFTTPPISNVSEDVGELDSKTIEQLNNFIQKNICRFSSHRNVTAIMPGQKISKSCYTNQPCITVYVLGKGRIPFGETELPRRVGDFDTDVEEGFVTELKSHRMLYHTVSRPLKLGVSVGVKGMPEAGTLGAIVKDSKNKMYLLSCEHVFNPHQVDENRKIEQPASMDYEEHIKELEEKLKNARKKQEPIADLEYIERKLHNIKESRPEVIGLCKGKGIKRNVEFKGKKYYIDAALALVPKERESSLITETTELCENEYKPFRYHSKKKLTRQKIKVTSVNGNYKPVANLSEDIKLHKCGRATRLTVNGKLKRGLITFRNKNELLNDIWCENCLGIESQTGKPFASDGDSGSLVLDEEGNACAMIFGGLESRGTLTPMACPMEIVLKELGKKIGSKLTIVGNATL